MTPKLFYWHLGTTTLPEAVAQLPTAAAKDAVALLYSARKCEFARLADEALLGLDGTRVGEDASEARVFNGSLEMRWLQSGFDEHHQRVGTAMVLHEGTCSEGKRRANIVRAIPQQYLLWGQGSSQATPDATAWSMLSTARIGQLAVPLPDVPWRRRVLLKVREYWEQEPEHGNCFVAEERLLGLHLYHQESHGV